GTAEAIYLFVLAISCGTEGPRQRKVFPPFLELPYRRRANQFFKPCQRDGAGRGVTGEPSRSLLPFTSASILAFESWISRWSSRPARLFPRKMSCATFW